MLHKIWFDNFVIKYVLIIIFLFYERQITCYAENNKKCWKKLVYFKNIKESELIFNSNPIKGCPAISGKCSLLVLTSESFTHRFSMQIDNSVNFSNFQFKCSHCSPLRVLPTDCSKSLWVSSTSLRPKKMIVFIDSSIWSST